MDEINWVSIAANMQIQSILETNQYLKAYGLVLSKEVSELLLEERKN